jgi:p-cumate 2,3-dioxygenase ferredoxin subunit
MQAMSVRIPLIPAAEILEGEIRGAALPDGRRIALYNINGALYATDDTCTHESASLSQEGMIEGGEVVCAWHFGSFDIATGNPCASPCSEPLQTYPLTVIDGVVHVEL